VLEHVRGTRWKVEWLDPNPGLVDYASSASIVVLWRQRRAFLRDEERSARMSEVSASSFPGSEHPTTNAVHLVFEATGEQLGIGSAGVLSTTDRGTLERVCDRAGIDVPDNPVSYRDRRGLWHWPFDVALTVAQAFARAEPAAALLVVDSQEQQWAHDAATPGGRHLVGLLNEYRAAFALVRQWAGMDQAVATRDAEIKRLRDLVERAVWDLRRPEADPEGIAARMERGLRGR
jgi:hypothetical protein